jgi:hypothetical protein
MNGKDSIIEEYAHVLGNSLINFFKIQMFKLVANSYIRGIY